jgi:RNA recognition motif-containing protein
MDNHKYFEIGGYQLRMLNYTPNLAFGGGSEMEVAKPDNSEEKCNLVVKGLNPEMTDQELDAYFSKYGPVKNCKIAKDPVTGKSKSYGFVWFQNGKDANAAMLDFKANRDKPYTLDWYKILAQRPNQKIENSQSFFD